MVRSLMFSFHLRGLEQVNASPLFVLLSLNLTSLVGRPIVRFGLGDIIYIANFVRFERLQKPNTSIPKGTNMETSKTSYVSVLKDGNQSDNSKLALVLDESCIKEHDFDISLIGKVPNFQEDMQDDLSSDEESQDDVAENKADKNKINEVSDVDRVSESSFTHVNDLVHEDINYSKTREKNTPHPKTLTNSRPLPDFEEYVVSTSADTPYKILWSTF
ncbi:hypothetical protein Tco_0877339 [Tanacetum coccineum]|uniref:Uncharacterized protein n=1 Tax=Tanacetum coccineum TaxID=301880 RepID=A0ABQ5BYA1_9ASTR